MRTIRAVRRGTGREVLAFTLIELLVVVAIIALLISILLPSLQRAREQAKKTVCAANMRSIGQAFTMYAEEFDGVWPAAVDSMGEQNRWPVPFFKGGIIHQKPNIYAPDGSEIFDGGDSIFLCPTEIAPRPIENWRNTGETVDRVEIGGSYAYSGEIHRDRDELRLGNQITPPFLNKVGNCRRQSDVLMLLENFRPIEKVSDPGWRYYRDNFFIGYRTILGDPVPSGPIADRLRIIGGRHFETMNALAMDSHVGTEKPEDIRYDQISWELWDGDPDPPPGAR